MSVIHKNLRVKPKLKSQRLLIRLVLIIIIIIIIIFAYINRAGNKLRLPDNDQQ